MRIEQVAACEIPPLILFADYQLRKILVGTDDGNCKTLLAKVMRKRADNVISFVTVAAKLRNADCPAKRSAHRKLVFQLFGRGFAICLVLRIEFPAVGIGLGTV